MKLIILESSNKTRTVKQYLNSNEYLVLSSNGHVTELAKTGKYGLGIDLDTFEPEFIVSKDKKMILKQLKEYGKKAEIIYLATDPDREGEAISYHLAKRLNYDKKIKRIFFNEITKNAVLKAIENPTNINSDLVESQITRRLLDRIIGFRLSKLLQKKIRAKSAGRVQSVALKLIVQRQEEIEKFIPEKKWLLSILTDDNFLINLTKKRSNKDPKLFINITIKSEKEFTQIKETLSGETKVNNIIKKTTTLNRPSPLKTATLVQLASSQFQFSIKKTMLLAQKLYEGVDINGKLMGLITYPRTDSERINEVFYQKMSLFIKKNFGSSFCGSMPSQKQKTKKKGTKVKIQDAHESIHITGELMNLNLMEKVLEKDLFRLYLLIYNYSLASIMTPAKFDVHKFELINKDYKFEIISENLIFSGFLKILSPNLKKFINKVPDWKIKNVIKNKEILKDIKISKPKPNFTEGSLIKTLEKLGIGRPSTYSTVVSKLKLSSYLEKKENKLFSTEIGCLVNKRLKKSFSDLINEKYTAELEEILDKIAKGEERRINFLKKFWKFFDSKMEIADKEMEGNETQILEKICEKCQKNLVRKQGRFGPFVACSGYPECRYIEKTPQKEEKLGRKCEKCQKDLVKKQGRYGPFVACSGYPECRYIEKTPQKEEKLGRKCEKCQKDLVKKQGRYGPFVACSGYPECRYIEKRN